MLIESVSGLVLMGGQSTRVLNKLFLCTKEGNPLFFSSYSLLKKFGFKPILCIHPRIKNIVVQLLRVQGEFLERDYTLFLDEYSGIVPVITEHLKEKDVFVVCGDNIYGHETCFASCDLFVSVKNNKSNERCDITKLSTCFCTSNKHLSSELDGYSFSKKEWVSRFESRDIYLKTPWFLESGAYACDTLTELLNLCSAKPKIVEDLSWIDLGTQEAIDTYYYKT
jgi:hypothetical protein